jgi:hypothetical protein
MKNHYSILKDLNYPFYTEVKAMGGFQYCKWAPLVSFENFAVKYQKEGNTLTPYDHEALKLVTQFKSRCIEQALIDYFHPKFNSNKPVLFASYWSYGLEDDSQNVKVVNVMGDITYFSSVAKASQFTGVSQNHIRKTCNSTIPNFVFSPIMCEDIHYVVKNRPTIEPKVNVQRRQLKGFDFSVLPDGVVSVINVQKKWLGMEYTYPNVSLIKESLGLLCEEKLIKLINIDQQIFSSVLNEKVYLVANKNTTNFKHLEVYDKKIKVTYLFTGEVQTFASRRLLCKTLKVAPKTLKKYLDSGLSFNNILFQYVD